MTTQFLVTILAEIKRLAIISDRYYWKGMKNDIHQHVKASQKCFVIHSKISKETPSLNSIPVAGNIKRQFVNSIIDNLMEHFQTDRRFSSAYYPQTNDQWERDNVTLRESLSKLVNDQGNNWHKFISGVLFAYHTDVMGTATSGPSAAP